MTQKLTIQDIANLAGVAKSTVSRYLNNGYVSKEKAMLIDKVILCNNYSSGLKHTIVRAKATAKPIK